ncbi:MAG: YfhO family protein, partial [Acidobacteriota bacterium]
TGWLLALGAGTPLFALLHRAGLLASFRYPVKFLVPASVGLALLGAIGIDGYLRAGAARAAAVFFTAVGLLLLLAWGFAEADFLHSAAFGALAGAALLWPRQGGTLWLKRHQAALLVGVACLDLAVAHATIQPSLPAAALFADFPEARLARTSGERVYLRRTTREDLARDAMLLAQHPMTMYRSRILRLKGNLPMAFDVRSVRGGPALRLAGQAAYLAAADRGPEGLPALRVGAARLFLSPDRLTHPDLELISALERPLYLYRLRGALPRVYLVGRWQVLGDRQQALQASTQPQVVAGKIVLLEEPPPMAAAVGQERGPSSVIVQAEEPDTRTFAVRAGEPSLLVVVESDYPGWQATVDGRAAPVLRANGNWMAVPVDRGEHNVQLRFRSRSLRIGAWISLLSTLLLLIILARRCATLTPWRQPRRQRGWTTGKEALRG